MQGGPRDASAWPSRLAPAAPGVTAAGQKHLARLRSAADFERVLRTRPRAISTHFALYHLADMSVSADRAWKGSGDLKLSTDQATVRVLPVDDLKAPAVEPVRSHAAVRLSCAVGLGLVVPKRHARRSVTRTLLKRQMRAAALARGDQLTAGLWVVRLRAPFERSAYPSAASVALRQAARTELDELMRRAVETADDAARRSS